MRISSLRVALVLAALAASASPAAAQSPDLYADMHWRAIGPTRAGRTRALAGVADQPNVFYIGFDNGGMWRSTDYGSNWEPLFDRESTSSIGAIAVAPSGPNIIYVGTGGGIIRPDLSTGDGIYKSTDAGATWTRLGLYDSQMIADVEVDPTNPDRLFVAVLGHPYGPNAERGIFRSLDGGRTFEKVLYKDEYTSGNDVLLDPSDPNTVYATLWQQQQSFQEGAAFGGAGTGIFKSTDGGTTWKPLTQGLPNVIQANLALAPSNPRLLYAIVAGTPRGAEGASTPGVVGFYTSTDGGEHWTPVNVPEGPMGAATPHVDTRPLARIGGGDLPTITVDPKEENVVYSATVVMWRSEDGGVHWSAVRGAYGGDDYQKIWINPNHPNIILTVSDQGGVGLRQPRRVLEQLVHPAHRGPVPRHHGQRLPLPGVQRAAGLGVGLREEPLRRRDDHVPRLAPRQHPGVRHRRARPRHASPRTIEAYRMWVRRYVRFNGQRHQSELACLRSIRCVRFNNTPTELLAGRGNAALRLGSRACVSARSLSATRWQSRWVRCSFGGRP